MELEESDHRALKLQRVLSDFIKHVEDLKNEDDPAGDGFIREFKILRDLAMKMRDENTHPTEEGMKPCNVKKNRYKDILPFDATRVILEEISGEQGSDYINANFIKDQYQNMCYIATQGPVQSSVYDFWRMIVQYKVKIITMACKLVEMGKKKCEQYWPAEVNVTVEYKDISVTLTKEEDMTEHCTKRFINVKKNGDAFMVTQFHYTGWPDHDIPNDFDVILEMMAEMREIKAADVDKAPIVIHCSAGCGRTGTICAIDYAWDILNTGNMTDNFSLFEIIKEMRMQRQSMIQAPEQYMMAHVTVQKLFQKHLDMMEDHKYGNIDDWADETDPVTGEASDSSDKQQPQKNSSLQNEIEQTLKLVTSPSIIHKVSEQHALLQPQVEQELEPVMNTPIKEAVTVFNVENIKNIPKSNKIDDTLNDESDMQNETPNYISSDDDRKHFKVETELFDNLTPLLGLKNSFGLARSNDIEPVEPCNIAPTTQGSFKSHQPYFHRVQSLQDESSGKFKTVISVGDLTTKQPDKTLSNSVKTMTYKSLSNPVESIVYKSLSDPVETMSYQSQSKPVETVASKLLSNPVEKTPCKSQSTPVEMLTNVHRNFEAKSLPANSKNNSSDIGLSSVQTTLPKQSLDMCSIASNSRQHSSLCDTGSRKSTHYVQLNPSAASASCSENKHAECQNVNPYSVADYSSANEAIKYSGSLHEFDPCSTINSDIATLDPSSTITSDIATLADPYSTVDFNITTLNNPYSTTDSDITALNDPYSTVGSDIAALNDPYSSVGLDITTLNDPYSSIGSNITTLIDNQNIISLSDNEVGYSVVKDQGYLNGHPDGLYSQVDRPKNNLSKPVSTDYEAIAFGAKILPPPIPARHYEDPSFDKTGSGDSTVPLKKQHTGSVIKNLFNPSKVTNAGPSTTESLFHPLIAGLGFKNKLGKKPGGPKSQPPKWQKK